MKILHLCLANFYIDKFSYQENLLPKYHKQIGYDVEIIASLVTFDKDGKISLLKKASKYKNEHGIKVTRLEYRKSILSQKLRQYIGTYEEISKARPDIIFIHGCQFVDIKYVVEYIKQNPRVKVFVDNHADFNNSAKNWISKNLLHKYLWKRCAHMIEPYTERFYGVLPARMDFLIDVYELPREKVDLLVMGADDEIVMQVQQSNNRKDLRDKLNIQDDEFLIITGGKIDHNKKEVFNLMKAINNIISNKVKLIVFGSVIPEYKNEFSSLISEYVKYIGWLNTTETYSYFNSADLIIFPGLHSVLWEQAVGMGKPCIFKYIPGFNHVDIGGNCRFIYEDSVEEIEKVILEIINNKSEFEKMKDIAEKRGMELFSYQNIARKSLSLTDVYVK